MNIVRVLRIYVVPGAVFQSVMVGGGYGTGREIVEYFTRYDSLGGMLGFLVSFVVIAAVLALTFEIARLFRAFDYRSFIQTLLGRGWIAYEILVLLQFLLVLAVLASAAGNISRDSLDLPYAAGLALMLAAIGLLTYYGRDVVKNALAIWSLLLYGVFIAFFVSVFRAGGGTIMHQVAELGVEPGWLVSGFKYALYNLAAVPLLLYVARDFGNRGQAMSAGVIAAGIALVPAVIFHVAFLASYPDVLDQPIPVYWLLNEHGSSILLVVYSVMLFGTFVETGAGLLQGINERIDAVLIARRGVGLLRIQRATIAVSAVIVSAALSAWGITNLIAKGYGTMAWLFLAVYILPLLTIGAWKVVSTRE